MAIDVRAVAPEEFDEYCRVTTAPFGEFVTPAGNEQERSVLDLDRALVATEGGQIVAAAASYAYEMTVPGGASVTIGGITGVAVLATHRRRGILRRLMERQLDDTVAWREPLAILNASESSIYGRFGYGLASRYRSIAIDRASAVLDAPAEVAGSFRLIPKEEAGPVLAPIYDAYRAGQPGAVSRSEEWWAIMLGDRRSWKGGGPNFVVVFEPSDGSPGGYVIYEVVNSGHPGEWKLAVQEQAAADPAVDTRLWQYCFDVDLVGTVERFYCPMDDPIEWRLRDPRAFRTKGLRDYLWVRILDVATALSARSYEGDDALVIDVEDAFRPEVTGRYRLASDNDASECVRTDEPAELCMGIDALGALYLGGVDVTTLARAGRIVELVPGAVRRADSLFATDLQPFCPTRF